MGRIQTSRLFLQLYPSQNWKDLQEFGGQLEFMRSFCLTELNYLSWAAHRVNYHILQSALGPHKILETRQSNPAGQLSFHAFQRAGTHEQLAQGLVLEFSAS